MPDGTDGATFQPDDPSEVLAFRVVPECLGAGVWCEPFDHSGRQGAVDGILHYPDGRLAALEVTSASEDGARQLYSLLAHEYETLPNPGDWTWSATVNHPRDLPELAERVGRIILFCEEHGIRDPVHAYEFIFTEPDLNWLAGSSAVLHGSPNLPKMDGTRERPLFVTPGSRGGAVDEDLVGFAEAVDGVVDSEHVKRRIAKLARSGQTEQHLFLLMDFDSLPFEVAYALAQRDIVPQTSPGLPGDVTHLWIVVTWSPWIFLVTAERLQRFQREPATG